MRSRLQAAGPFAHGSPERIYAEFQSSWSALYMQVMAWLGKALGRPLLCMADVGSVITPGSLQNK